MKVLTETQQEAVSYLYENNEALVIAPTGTGKTAISLTVISELLGDNVLTRVLVVCPAKVVSGWVDEVKTWELDNLRLAGGTGKDALALMVDGSANVLITSYESLPILLKMKHGCTGVVYDEITRLKSPGGVSFRAMRKALKVFMWRVGLSATPISESFEALYGMTLMLDNGRRFGTSKEFFMQRYFNTNPYQKYDITLKEGMAKIMTDIVGTLVYEIPESVKREKLTKPHEIYLHLDYDSQMLALQDELAEQSIAMVGGVAVLVANKAVLSSKFRQLAQGFIYNCEGEGKLLWSGRFDFVNTLIDEDPVVITYEFDIAAVEFKRRYPHADFINGATSKKEFEDIKSRWGGGKGRLLFLQVGAGSHGLNFLQMSAWRMVNFAPIWSNDKSIQLIGRLDRTGQTRQVEVLNIVVNGSIDEMVVERLAGKKKHFMDFLKHLK